MILSVVYLLVRRMLGCLMVLAGREVSKDAELLVLRHDTRCCAVRSAGSATSRVTGCGSRHCPSSSPATAGVKCSR